jgi:hypothetical protein
MKQLHEEDYNYFQLKGVDKEKNAVIKNGFERRMSAKTIAFLVNLTPKEVENRIKEMKLTRPTRARIALSPAN